ncbi:MAG: PKD domain-containing protein [Ilumatobacteraceae bacterium]|nr:PKD domain-containing protein [Ilumatobacteraceae bacterium]
MKRFQRHAAVLGVVAMMAGGLVVAVPTNVAQAAGPPVASLPTDNPANWTPNVLDGQVNSIWQFGNKVVIGGTFTQVADSDINGGVVHDQAYVAAFDAATGVVDTGFDPVLNDGVEVVIPGTDANTLFIGGDFNTVDGENRRKVAKLNVADGSLVEAFDINGMNGRVRDLRLVDTTLYAAGLFTVVGGADREYLASFDAASGDVTGDLDLDFAGLHSGGVGKVIKIETTPDAGRMLITGNFTSIEGVERDQVALIDLSTTPATVSDWQTDWYAAECASAFDSYTRDLDISADGAYAIVVTTGAYRAGRSCDTVSRLELDDESAGVTPTWVSYTGGDTSYSVEIHDGVAYVGGHMRWFNNPYAGDRHGAGGVARAGMGALDVVTGLPFSWNPTRTRGIGLFDYHVTAQGIWAGSDTDRWNDELRMKLAFFPWTGGTTVLGSEIGDLPADIYQLGNEAGTTGTPDQTVLYRVNAGGPALASADDGPAWEADTSTLSSYRNSGSNAYTAPDGLAVPQLDSAVPDGDMDRPPAHLWTTERWDPSGGTEMQWNFPVDPGADLTVRIFLANRCTCTNGGNERIFDVQIDGVTRVDDLDLSKTVGHDVGTVRSFDITADADGVDIDFIHGAEDNPLVSGIEIIDRGTAASGTLGTQDDVRTLTWNGADAPVSTPIPNTTVPWRTVRGAFMVNADLFTFHADGTLMKRTFDGSDFGPGRSVDGWSNDIMADMPTISGIFFDPDTASVYYTVEGEGALYTRTFLPESGVLNAQATTVAAGDVGALDPTRVAGMFLADGRLYLVDDASGELLSMAWADGAPVGPTSLADDTADWRARALFLATAPNVNEAPTAVIAAPTCDDNVCEFDGTGSSDVDGTIVSHQWDFGDGGLDGTGASTSHTYGAAGAYTVTLTVTDDDGAIGTTDVVVNPTAPPNEAPTAVAAEPSCVDNLCTFDGTGSSDADGTIVSYLWFFGDGETGTGSSPSHTYEAGGSYTVTLIVTDDEGATGTTDAVADPTDPPNASPTAVIGEPICVDNVCEFDGTGSSDVDGTIVSYLWFFGDGETGTGSSPSHTYEAGGSYTVTLTVTDDEGATGTTDAVADPTDPSNAAPTASAAGSCTANVCEFDGTGSSDVDGTIVSYLWDFGDGETGSGPSPSHSYGTGGEYTVTLTVTDDDGATGSDELDVAPAAADDLVSVVPARLLESRPGELTVDHEFEGIGRRGAGSVTALKVTGRGGVPADADAVLLNVAAVLPDGLGFLTVYPCGVDRPLASNVNYGPGDVVPNAVLAKVGDGGRVCIYTLTGTDIIADVNGYVPAGGSPVSVVPARLLESRPGELTVDHEFEGIGRRGAGSVTALKVTGRGGVPADADAVLLNVAAVLPDGLGFLTVYPCGVDRPLASNVNYGPGDVVPNAVLAKVGDGGRVCIYTLTGTDIIADVNGYVPAGGSPVSVVPARLLESRPGELTVDHEFEGIGRPGAGSVTALKVTGRGGVPADADAVLLNVAAVLPDGLGFLTVYPCGVDRPLASNVNYGPGDVVPNAVLAKVGDGGRVCIYTLTGTDIIADVNGYVP